MYRFNSVLRGSWALFIAAILILGMAACDGSKGKTGAAGADGAIGPEGPAGPQGDPAPVPDAVMAAVEAAAPESCAVCHEGVGVEHQSIYDQYADTNLAMTFNSVTSVAGAVAGEFDVTLNFSITDNGQPFVGAAALPSMQQKRFFAVQYESAAREFRTGEIGSNGGGALVSLSANNIVPGVVAGDYVLTQTGFPFDPLTPVAPFDGAQVYGYIARGELIRHAGGSGSELSPDSHVHLYDDVANAALAFGTALATDANAYASAANVGGCEKCHGQPYLKHGFRDPIIAGLPDFASCKSCHNDDRIGGHEDWQYMVDDPVNWATAGLLETEVETKYAYKAKLMNDVHMAHAMEFPYPQSMSNCATCHGPLNDAAGVEIPGTNKLAGVLADANFTPETCKSCHPVEGLEAWPADAGTVARGDYRQGHRAPPLEYLWTVAGVESFHDATITDCNSACHLAGGVAAQATFSMLHTGYAVNISNAAGERYRDLYTASIDDVSIAGDVMTIAFTVSDPAIAPELLVSFYGWDSKHYIVPSHTRDGSLDCLGRGSPPPPAGCRLEIEPGDTNKLFPTFEDPGGTGSWQATVDLAAWVDSGQPAGTIPELIADGTIRRAEITVTPQLNLEDLGGTDQRVVLDAVGATFDLGAEAVVADWFKGENAIVDTDKCDVCHDSLASSFHDGSGRGGGGSQVCKNCHNPTFPGSHIEMASRSIDNYVHAIHSFQDFDLAGRSGWTFNDVFDPVLAKRYDQHIGHIFPNFTIRNCEACHVSPEDTADGATVVYNVPDQRESMPGVQSASSPVATWYEMVEVDNIPDSIAVEVPAGRNIGSVPEQVVGPASRACGGCHRAAFIKADEAGNLAAWNAHTEAFGTFVENDTADDQGTPVDDEYLFAIIDYLMGLFE